MAKYDWKTPWEMFINEIAVLNTLFIVSETAPENFFKHYRSFVNRQLHKKMVGRNELEEEIYRYRTELIVQYFPKLYRNHNFFLTCGVFLKTSVSGNNYGFYSSII